MRTAERCNGLDDDADMLVDEGVCPDAAAPAPMCDPQHALLEAYMAAYPIDSLPCHRDELGTDFLPMTADHVMTDARVEVGGEFIDLDRGGVTVENVVAARDSLRDGALLTLQPGDEILSMMEPTPEVTLRAGRCSGCGVGFGSVVYRTADGAANELVYIYLGICHGGDVEGFYHSLEPGETCEAGSLI